MTTYYATVRHHSISRARLVTVGNSLTAAKRAASREFGDEFSDYVICIYDRPDMTDLVASRRVGDRKWDN